MKELFQIFKVRVLVTFYCDKLDDTETIIPALKGLALLSSLSTCVHNDTMNILRGYAAFLLYDSRVFFTNYRIFKHVKMKALTAPNRFAVFSIIDSLMSRQRDSELYID